MSPKRGPEKSYPSPDAVKLFVYENSSPVVTTSSVAEEFDGVTRRTIANRLNQLHDSGAIGKMKIPPNTAVWFPDG